MKSSLETLEGNKVKLSVNVDETEFDRNIDQAFRKLAREVRLPGFRAGKAPRRVLEARIGVAPARQQALQDSIPEYLAKAVREHDVDLIATPEVELKAGEDEGPIEFDATCEIRPQITVPGYDGLQVTLANPAVTDEEIDSAVDAERGRHGTLTTVERPAADGDYVTIDLAATRDGEEVTGLNTEDWSYQIGQGWVAEDFDEQLLGVSAGDRLEFSATPKGTEEPADFVVSVANVQEHVLPDVDDEWVADNLGEFDTVEAWRDGLRQQVETQKLNRIRQSLVGDVTAALTALTEIDAPEAMVNADLSRRVEATVGQLQQSGIDMDQWFSATGQDAASFVEGLRGASEQAVKVDLALRAVSAAEALDADEGDLGAEYQRIALQMNEKPDKVRKAYEQNDLVPELVAQIRKSKALDWLVHHVRFVDADGAELDRDLVLGHRDDADGEHLDSADVDHRDPESADEPAADETEEATS
ncbi:MAG: trigger factor [Desertimonas sp.]